ncbi:hypothetical protein [Terrisporobacter sp.]|uniref:hypothetical protein n=1 Tax=Terrisporobacter sp. TaxID=1965305 RepID=UPI0028A27548|nr:hypothetical protein [Terrisporobacter sp.]
MGTFKIKDAESLTLKSKETDECIVIDYLNNYELEKEDRYCIVDGEDVTFKHEEITKIENPVMLELEMNFTFKQKDYSVIIYNVSEDYVVRCPEIVGEYCQNIIKQLAIEGHKFVNGEHIDFQKYLV